jgi:hypothetical protein
MKACRKNNVEFHGNADQMYEHRLSEYHCWNYFERIYGNSADKNDYDFEEVYRQTINAERKYRYREYASSDSKDYEKMKNGHRPDSSYIRAAKLTKKEKGYSPMPLPTKRKRQESYEEGRDASVNHNLTTKQEKEEIANDSFALNCNGNLARKRRMSEENTAGAGNKISLVSFPEEKMGWNVPPNMQVKAQPDLSLIENEPRHAEMASTPPIPEDPVKKFNRDIADCVKNCLNNYYLYN